MKRIALVLVVAAALGAPSAALASGVVLKVQRASHLVAVRTTPTAVMLVHTNAAARLHVGQRVAVHARRLRNGTFSATSMAVLGRAHRTSFRGLVLRSDRSRLVVSAAGAVLTIRRGSHTAAANDNPPPPPGSSVSVTVRIDDDGNLDEDQASPVLPTSPGGSIEGRLEIGAGNVTVSDDETSLVLTVPTGFDLSGFANGDEVLATFSRGADGSLTLATLSRDDAEHADGAPATAAQPGEDGGSGDQGDGNGGSAGTGGSTGTGDTGSGGGGHDGDGGGQGDGGSDG